MSYKPEINVFVDTAVLAAVQVQVTLPTFVLDVDGDEGDYYGVIEGPGHDITFYGPTPDHVIGAAYRYASKLTEGAPFDLQITIDDEDVEAELVPLP